MPFNIDRLLSVIHKTQTWIFAALALPFVVQLTIEFSGIKVPASLLVLETIFSVVGIFSLCLLTTKMTFAAATTFKEWWRSRVIPFNRLDELQKQYLISLFRKGTVDFAEEEFTLTKHWFRELEKGNYIIYQAPARTISVDDLIYKKYIYRVTTNGWKKIEQYVEK